MRLVNGVSNEFFFGLSSKGRHSGLGFGGHESPAEGKNVSK